MGSIRALEKQIEEGKGDIIKFKRARNSLLNISVRVTPEILGDVFACSGSFDLLNHVSRGYRRDPTASLHFIPLVQGRFSHPGTLRLLGEHLTGLEEMSPLLGRGHPLDPDGDDCDPHALFNGSLQDGEVRIGVMRDTIRQVHLASDEDATLSSIISSLTPNDKSAQNENIESIVWRKGGFPP